LKEEELLIPREQEARQKVTEMKAAQESEKSQGSVLKAIMQARDSKEIEGIHGRLGDLGAIDGITLCFLFWLCVKCYASISDLFFKLASYFAISKGDIYIAFFLQNLSL
jgi:hypothetical protein